MRNYGLHVDLVATGAIANTYTTILGVKFAATTGHKARLRRLVVGGASSAAQDVSVAIRLRRTNNAADGTSTAVNVNTIGTLDAGDQAASNVAAIGKNYTVEPTTKENGYLGGGSINTRGALVLEWAPCEGPEWGQAQTLVIEGAPGSAAAANLAIALEWEE